MSIIEKLIEEFFTPCHVCQGTGKGYDKDTWDYSEDDCPECDGSGEVLSYDAEQLFSIIENGRR